MPAVGGSSRKVASLPAYFEDGGPQWLADGSEIAVPVRASRSSAEIVNLQTQSSRLVSLALPRAEARSRFCHDLSWSPKGDYFACVDAVFRAEVSRLWLISSSGGDPKSLTDDRTQAWNPVWTSDGRSLFYVSDRGGAMDLWHQRVGKDGAAESAPVPVTAGLGIRSAVFSSDGTKLAYSRGRFSSNVWRVPIFPDRVATWADVEQITFDTTSDADFVDVSPDGERLALTSDRAGNKDIWVLPSDGGEMMQLTTEPTHDWAPKWSPDGAHIVFYSHRSGNRDIWVMPSDGGPARQLTSHPADDTVPTWLGCGGGGRRAGPQG